MSYSLEFHEKALKEFKALDKTVRERFKAKLQERLENPRVEASRLHGTRDRYKIKFKHPGVRLVYEVVDHRLVVCVVAIANREGDEAYVRAKKRQVRR